MLFLLMTGWSIHWVRQKDIITTWLGHSQVETSWKIFSSIWLTNCFKKPRYFVNETVTIGVIQGKSHHISAWPSAFFPSTGIHLLKFPYAKKWSLSTSWTFPVNLLWSLSTTESKMEQKIIQWFWESLRSTAKGYNPLGTEWVIIQSNWFFSFI